MMAQQQPPAADSGSIDDAEKTVKALWAYELKQLSKLKNSVVNLVSAESFKTFKVRRQMVGAVHRVTTLRVKLYSLGAGVAIPGQGGDLPCREGAFELEAHGIRLVVDQLGAREADWLVAPVKCDVAAIGQAVQAVDQKQAAEIGRGLSGGHELPLANTVIFSLPHGTGKTTHAQELARRFGCTAIVDEWLPSRGILPGALHLTTVEVAA